MGSFCHSCFAVHCDVQIEIGIASRPTFDHVAAGHRPFAALLHRTRLCRRRSRHDLDGDNRGLEARKLEYILGARERTDAIVRQIVLANNDPFVPLLVERKAGQTQLFVKQVTIEGKRYVLCRNEEEAEKDRRDRAAIVAALDAQFKKGEKGSSCCAISIGCNRCDSRIAAPIGWCAPTPRRMSRCCSAPLISRSRRARGKSAPAKAAAPSPSAKKRRTLPAAKAWLPVG
jgi:hypothetical protein